MNRSGTARSAVLSLMAAAILAVPLFAPPAQAQDRRAMREHEGERARFQTQHWAWDSRFNHNHYYPAVGYAVPSLPAGHAIVNYRGGRLFFHSGVWFRYSGGRYLVIRPPFGAIIPALPVGYTQLWAGGVPYYYANDVYYEQSPQGYMVAQPPSDANWQTQGPPGQYSVAPQQQYPVTPQAQYPSAPPPQYSGASQAQYGGAQGNPGQPAPGMWYYCDSSRAYYPHVATCSEPWRAVPAAAPPR